MPVLWSVADRVGHIVLNRPAHANALDLEMSQALGAAVSAAARADVGAVLLSAEGAFFCAGGDIQAFALQRHALPSLIQQLLLELHPAMERLAALPVPVVSALQGPVAGAGIGLALCADFVLASDGMKLRGGYAGIGLSPDMGASYYLAQRAGPLRARQILMTNRSVPADECLRLGLIDELHPADALLPAAQNLARRLAQGPGQALRAAKRLCAAAAHQHLPAHLACEQSELLACAQTADAAEGISAFLEKRAPRFPGASLHS